MILVTLKSSLKIHLIVYLLKRTLRFVLHFILGKGLDIIHHISALEKERALFIFQRKLQKSYTPILSHFLTISS